MNDLRHITFVVEGTSSDLSKAAGQAADSLRSLARESVNQSRVAAQADDRTIASNRNVARSYESTAGAARSAAESAAAGARAQVGAGREIQTSAQRTTVIIREAATAQARGWSSTARAASASANAQAASARRIERSFGAAGSEMTRMGRNTVLVATGIAAATAWMGVKFEQSTMKLHTQAGVSLTDMNKLRDGILAMAPSVGAMPEQLSGGLYHVVSSMDAVLPKATKVRQELEILHEAAKGAAIGGSNLEQTAYVLSSAMNSLGLKGHDAGKTMAALNAIVGTGDMKMQDLVGAMSTGLIPAAENFGVSLQSVGAGLAYLVDRGTPATLAATRLRMSFALMGAPTKQAAKILTAIGMGAHDVKARTEAMTTALEKAGLRTTTLAADLRKPNGIAVALRDLNSHLLSSGLNANASAALISRAFGGGRSGTAILEMAQHTQTLTDKYNQQSRVIKDYNKDWVATTHTIQFQFHQLEASAESLGTKLGLALIPKIQGAIDELRTLVTWFEHNQGAAKALGEVFAGVLSVAMAAWFISLGRRLVAAGKEVVTFGRGLAGIPSRLESAIAGSSSATRGAAGAGAVTATGGFVGGLRTGFGLPGSESNPLVVAMIGGSVAGAGAGVGSAARTAAREEVSSGGVILPPGVRSTVAAETQQVTRTFGASLRGAFGKAVGGLTRGAGIAGVGYLGSQLAGQAIGGSTGRTVASVGGTAAVGAGIGSVIGPEGTAAGAVVGALVGLLHHIGRDYAGKVAEQATKGLGGQTHDLLQQRIANEIRGAQQSRNDSTTTHLRGTRGGGLGSHRNEHPDVTVNPAERAKAIAQERQLGTDMARAMERSFSRFRFNSVDAMVDDFGRRMHKMPVLAKETAAQAMIQYARSLEKNGNLPKGATNQLISRLESAYPPLKAFLTQQGYASMQALATTFKTDAIKRAAEKQVADVGQTFQQLGAILAQSGLDARGKWLLTMDFLKVQTQHGTKAMREAARKELESMTNLAEHNGKQFAIWMAFGTGAAASSTATNLNALTTAVATAMQYVTGQTSSIAKSFGVKAVKYVVQHPKQIVADIAGVVGAVTHAQGGWVGQPGERGRDTVHAVLGRGEAVVNGKQQQPVERAMAFSKAMGVQPYGSLNDLFSNVRAKHYMATGGFAGGKVFTASVFGGHNDPSAFGRSTASGKTANDSLWGYAELSNPPGSLNFSALGHQPMGKMLGFSYRGKTVQAPKVDVGAGGPGLGGAIRGVDLTYAVGKALGVGGLANILVTGLTGALANATSSAASMIAAPKIGGPGGPFQTLANAAVSKATDAANHYLGKLQPAGSGGLGASGPSFSGPTAPGLGVFDGLRVAKWIIPELAYARAHDWGGHITSGYRPGFDPHTVTGVSEHSKTVYPGGAVDFGGMQDPAGYANRAAFEAATAGYTGPRLIPPQGFRDDGHMSGTGHAVGGWVGLARGRAPSATTSSTKKFSSDGTAKRTKQHISKKNPKHKPRPAHKPKDPIAAALAPFDLIPDVNSLPGNVDWFTARMKALSEQEGLLGNAGQFLVTVPDMPYLTPTMQPGEGPINAGMAAADAKNVYDQASSVNGSKTNPQLDLQGQLLDWISQQADHEILGQSDISILSPTFKPTGVPLSAGMMVPSGQLKNLGMQILVMNSQVEVERRGLRTIKEAVHEREVRKGIVDKLAQAAKARLDNINHDLQRLTSKSLHERLAAASDSSAQSHRIYDAETERGHYRDLIAHERSTKHPDKSAISGWHARENELSDFIHAQRRPSHKKVDQARVAILRNDLMNTRKGVEDDLNKLTGNSTKIGKSGMLGTIRDQLTTLATGSKDMNSDIADVLQSQIPSAQYEALRIQQSLPESVRPTLAAGDSSTGPDMSAMNDLLKQQNAQLAQSLALSEGQSSVFAGMLPLIPKYIHGGLVQNTGLALVHAGEWINPSPQGPYGSQLAPASAGPTHLHVHLSGEAQHFIDRVEATVDERMHLPRNVRTISTAIGRRKRMIFNSPGGGR